MRGWRDEIEGLERRRRNGMEEIYREREGSGSFTWRERGWREEGEKRVMGRG